MNRRMFAQAIAGIIGGSAMTAAVRQATPQDGPFQHGLWTVAWQGWHDTSCQLGGRLGVWVAWMPSSSRMPYSTTLGVVDTSMNELYYMDLSRKDKSAPFNHRRHTEAEFQVAKERARQRLIEALDSMT